MVVVVWLTATKLILGPGSGIGNYGSAEPDDSRNAQVTLNAGFLAARGSEPRRLRFLLNPVEVNLATQTQLPYSFSQRRINKL